MNQYRGRVVSKISQPYTDRCPWVWSVEADARGIQERAAVREVGEKAR